MCVCMCVCVEHARFSSYINMYVCRKSANSRNWRCWLDIYIYTLNVADDGEGLLMFFENFASSFRIGISNMIYMVFENRLENGKIMKRIDSIVNDWWRNLFEYIISSSEVFFLEPFFLAEQKKIFTNALYY